MRQLPVLILLLVLGIAAAPVLHAQSSDPSDLFLTAYMSVQKAQKQEEDGKYKLALQTYRYAAGLLTQIRDKSPDWQPVIVTYRLNKTSEAIALIEKKISVEGPGPTSSDTGSTMPDNGEPPLPQNPDDNTPPPPPSPQVVTPGSGSDDEFDRMRADYQRMKIELADLKKKYADEQQENADLTAKFNDSLKQLDKARVDESQIKAQLEQAEEDYKNAIADRTKDTEGQKEMKDDIARLQNELKERDAERDAAQDANEEAEQRVATFRADRDQAVKDRDQAVDSLKKAQEGQQQVDKLMADNAALTKKLDDAEKTIASQNASGPEKDAQIATLKKDLADAHDQLADALKSSQENLNSMHDLQEQLETATGQLSVAKANGANSEDTKKLADENDLLRGIVKRERNEEAYRDQQKQILLDELGKLHVPSNTGIVAEVDDLARPLKLTDKERALFKETDVSISDNSVSISAEKPPVEAATTPAPMPAASPAPPQPAATPTPATTAASPAPSPATAGASVAPAPIPAVPSSTPEPDKSTESAPRVETSITPPVSPELLPQANQAKELFERGNYREAEKTYRAMMEQDPKNTYILKNLGVVLFRSGKLKQAEETFRKALAVSPDDEFSLRTLGIVCYTEGNFDGDGGAVSELTKALAINPKDAIGHNYLGITASAKGWQEAARKELEAAAAIDPNYADAHFNLAVIYLTTPPVDKDNARKHYKRALELGSEPDPALEQLLNKPQQ